MLKKIKLVLSIIISLFIIICIVIGIIVWSQFKADKAEAERRQYIAQLIQAEIDASTAPSKDNEPNSGILGDLDLDDIISGSINDSKVDPVFTNIEMINSSTFKVIINDEEKIYRLIGVADDGNAQQVKNILESLSKIVITHDVMKHKKGEDDIEQIYLWNNDDKDINNMINLQLIKNCIAKTTYNGVSYSEHPNVKYSTQFISASKDTK